MTQSPEEPIRAFCSCLVGMAELCDFVLTCTNPNCRQKNSYCDPMVMQVLLKGMHNANIRTRVLSRTQSKELVTLLEITNYIAAEEASSASFASYIAGHMEKSAHPGINPIILLISANPNHRNRS